MQIARRLTRAAAGALAVIASVALVPVIVSAAHASETSVDPAAAENVFVARVNVVRASQGLAPLRIDPILVNVARQWAASLSKQNCVCHHPEFLTGDPDDAARVIPTNWIKIGENVGTGSTADQIEDAFEKSPKHRQNLLDPDFDSIGVGVVVVNDVLWVSQQFQDLPGRTPSGAVNSSLATSAAPDELALAAPRPRKARKSTAKPKVTKKPAASIAF